MAKFTFETDDAAEARTILEALETRSDAPTATRVDNGNISSTPEDRQPPAGDDSEVDIHGMRWDPTIHASTRNKTEKGAWKAGKGKAAECSAAVAQFKARGGNIEAPTTTGMPGVAATTGMPGVTTERTGMPTAPVDMPPPVTMDQVTEKTIGMMERGTLSVDGYRAMLAGIGITDGDPSIPLSTNESMRAAFYGQLCEIEPDLA